MRRERSQSRTGRAPVDVASKAPSSGPAVLPDVLFPESPAPDIADAAETTDEDEEEVTPQRAGSLALFYDCLIVFQWILTAKDMTTHI